MSGSGMAQLPSDGNRLTRSSHGTLHHQLYQTLLEMINSGQVKPGDRMSTEAELVESYRVSRTTARRALDELRRQGLVDRQPGKGTFVLRPRVHAAIPHLHSVTEEIEQLGYEAGIVPLAVEQEAADETVAQQLQINVGDPVLLVRRIRTADGQPVYVGESKLNLVAFPQLAQADFDTSPLYKVFEGLGREVLRAEQWLSAVPAPRQVARSLEMKTSAPTLKLERIIYLTGDVPVESVTGFFNGQIYKHYSEPQRLAPTDAR